MDRNPESPWNPRIPADISPVEFERLVVKWLRRSAKNGRHQMQAAHLGVVHGAGGDYKIDVLVKLTFFGGATITILVECKHQGRPVEREDAMILEAKLRDVGAHKGMLFSSSGFQRGALQYSEAHGIATVAVVRGEWLYETKSAGTEKVEPPPWARFDTYAGIRMTASDEAVHCHTIEMARLEPIQDWLAQ